MDYLSIITNIIFFVLVLLVVFLVDFYFITKDRAKKVKGSKEKRKVTEKLTTEGMYLISRFNLDDKKINLRMLNFYISIINAFIIAFVSTGISLINVNVMFQLLIGFVLLFALIYAIYEIFGRHLKKKWGKD
jgi:uncharacterized Tic20 family protein